MSEQVNIKEQLLNKMNNNEFVIYFYTPSINFPSGGVGVLFKQARVLKDAGFNVKFLFEPKLDEKASYQASKKAQKRIFVYEKFNPTWMDVKFDDIEFMPQVAPDEKGVISPEIHYNDGTKAPVSPTHINGEDFLIIPEGYGNIMAQMAQAGCKKIILAQSWIYILNSLQAGQTWDSFGIKDCISVSDAITEYVTSIMPNVKIKQYSQSINRDLFNVPEKLSDKLPLIGYSCSRGPENQMKTFNAIKNFQMWYPNYKWMRFIELSNMSREEYAERLKDCAIVLYTDEIAGFGTLPLEAMASGTHVVGFSPFGGKEYINQGNGFWANNGDVFQLSEFLGIAVDKWLNGELDQEDVQKSYEETLARYTVEKEKESILKIYQEYINERVDEIGKL